MEIKEEIKQQFEASEDKEAFLNNLKELLHELSPQTQHPVDLVRWVDISQVEPNNYNPNAVAQKEMSLLHHSIKADGYTQPVVTTYDPEKKKYIVVGGFHRYFVCRSKKDVSDSTNNKLPIVVLKKDVNDLMAATVRHNRARGEHSVGNMGQLVFKMLMNGWKDEDICNEIGLDPDELLKLKHISGFSKLFANSQYGKSWETGRMIKLRKESGTKI